MNDFAKRVIESRDSDEIAALLREADQAARDNVQDLATEIWSNLNNDRSLTSTLLLRMTTGFAKCKDYQRGAELARILVDYARECGNQEMLCKILGTTGVMLMESGETPEARKVFEEIAAVSEGIGNTYLRIRSIHNLGIIESLEGQRGRAIARFEEALQLAQSAGDDRGEQLAKRSLAIEREVADSIVCPQCSGKGLVFTNQGVRMCPRCQGSGKG